MAQSKGTNWRNPEMKRVAKIQLPMRSTVDPFKVLSWTIFEKRFKRTRLDSNECGLDSNESDFGSNNPVLVHLNSTLVFFLSDFGSFETDLGSNGPGHGSNESDPNPSRRPVGV
ncbi:hypothetical protein C2G38_2167351 [Gigaspora rosea]|uniref:Uncharacterized protein n=1 Tax=Gigaspora rosea TaxID=44941 RepID=A0A397VY04_9GLOM|nr:hypothetical protein C2G38_2167351 [Gigaspora rosea]